MTRLHVSVSVLTKSVGIAAKSSDEGYTYKGEGRPRAWQSSFANCDVIADFLIP